jgi:type III secretion protein Q
MRRPVVPLPFDLPLVSRGYAELHPSVRAAGARVAEQVAAALSSALSWPVELAGRPVPGLAQPRAGCGRLTFDLPALPGTAQLEIGATLIAQVADRLAGGPGNPAFASALTPMEVATFELLGLIAVEGLRGDPFVEERFTPRLTRGAPVVGAPGVGALVAGAPVAGASLEVEIDVRIGESRGTGRLLVPAMAVRALRAFGPPSEEFSAMRVTASYRRGASAVDRHELEALAAGDVLVVEGDREVLLLPGGLRLGGRTDEERFHVEEMAMAELAGEFPVTLEVELARVSIALSDLARLERGAVLPLPIDRSGRVALRLGDREVARGELVEIEGAIGVRIVAMEG